LFRISRPRQDAAGQQADGHETTPHELVAVQVDRGEQEEKDGREPDRHGHCITFREIMAS
jgi:hypothetical protein